MNTAMFRIIFYLILLSLFANAQTNVLRGRILDQFSGDPVIGAKIDVQGAAKKAFTDRKGYYLIKEVPDGHYPVRISADGYLRQRYYDIPFFNDTTIVIDLTMRSTSISYNARNISSAAGHKQRALKVATPLAIMDRNVTVGEVYPGSLSPLKDVMGIDMVSTGLNQRVIGIGGMNSVTNNTAFILSDHRQVSIPGLGLNLHSGISSVLQNIDRVEVIPGNESVVYGVGADAGVIHYISKDPFTQPGTFLSYASGERSTSMINFRNSYALFNRVGYSISGEYAKGLDWELDPLDRQDQKELARDLEGLQRNTDYERLNLNGLFKIRFADNISLSANAGYSRLDANILSDLGSMYVDSLVHMYGQVRLNAGGLFAQAYSKMNTEGTFLNYTNGDQYLDKSTQLYGQAQYHFKSAYENLQFVVGGDMNRVQLDTDQTRYGRNEVDLENNIMGAYLNAHYKISSKFEINGAARMDQDDIFDKSHLSPRFGILYHPSKDHIIRGMFNRGVSFPSNTEMYLDVTLDETTFNRNGTYTLGFQAMGALNGFTFNNFRNDRLVTSFASLSDATINPFGNRYSFDQFPVGVVYLQTLANLQDVLADPEADIPAQFKFFSQTQSDAFLSLMDLLGRRALTSGETTGALLGMPNLSRPGYQQIDNLEDISPLQESTTQRFELGYKGLIENRFLISVDGYYTQKQNFVGPLALETPYVYLPTEYIRGRMIDILSSGDAEVRALLDQIGLDPSVVTGTLTNFFSQTPAAVVQPDPVSESGGLLPSTGPNQVGALLTYRNYGEVQYFGTDISIQYLAEKNLTLFANVSLISDNFFDNEELKETNTSLNVALNVPRVKFKGGLVFTVPKGVTFGASFRYAESYPIRSGPYVSGLPKPYGNGVGGVDPLYITDVNLGFDFGKIIPGFRIDGAVKNLFSVKYREFAGAPSIGRVAIARAGFSF